MNVCLQHYLIICFVYHIVCQDVLVKTQSGYIQGIKTYHRVENGTVYEFRGIPYAKPPIADLRFRKPEKLDKWTGILNATKYGPSCIQNMQLTLDLHYLPNTDISEDCLLLNIYVPRKLSTFSNMSVMIWIHGGSFFVGQGMRYDGYRLALKGNVIMVTINYRLGIFGFMSTGDSASPGNYGIWDQCLAIEWVKNNIAAFGGNPSSITLFGQSAGGISVSLHAFIPRNKGLFKRIIAQSGIANSHLTLSKKVKNNTLNIAFDVGCLPKNFSYALNGSNSIEVVHCLRSLNASTLQRGFDVASNKHGFQLNYDIMLTPVVDNDLIVDFPSNLILNRSSEAFSLFKSVDFIIGTTNGEGSVFIPKFYLSKILYMQSGISCNDLCNLIAPTVSNEIYTNISGVSDAICHQYAIDNCTSEKSTQQAVNVLNLVGDVLFVSPATQTLEIHSVRNTKSKSFQYIFTLPSESEIGTLWPNWFENAGHASEILYLFPEEGFYLRRPHIDHNLREAMGTYWTNFAKSGNPNDPSLPYWPEYNPTKKSFLKLGTDIVTGNDLYSGRMNFWLKQIPNILKQKPTNASSSNERSIKLNPVIVVLFSSFQFIIHRYYV